MNNAGYRNFDVHIRRDGAAYYVQTQSPDAGESSQSFTLPFSEDEVENLLRNLDPTQNVRRFDDSRFEAARTLGGGLFKAVFSGAIGHSIDRAVQSAKLSGEHLRVRLRLTGVPELARLPWEYLYEEQNARFLTLSYKTSLARYLELPQPIQPLAVKPPLRALVMTPSPIGHELPSAETEWNNLKAALSKMPSGLVEIVRMDSATLDALRERLSGGEEFHIFHYFGHGGFEQRTGRSTLLMEREDGTANRVDGQSLGVLLHNHSSLRLAILNACEGGVANTHDVFSGIAQNLIRQEVPAVIAMQFKISVTSAIAFARSFYESLAYGKSVDESLLDARLAIFTVEKPGLEWGTPVLYLRSHDGRIFDLAHSALPKPEPKAGAEKPNPTKSPIYSIKLPPSAPTGTLPLDSPLYIERTADKTALELITYPGVTLSIQALGQNGGSSLLLRVMETARLVGKQTIFLDFQRSFDDKDLSNAESFFRGFCVVLTHRLGKEDHVAQFWEQYQSLSIGERCTIYLRQLLQSLGGQPLTLAMDEVDRLIDTKFRSGFFAMLRNWHNDRAVDERFARLDLVLLTSIEPHQLIDEPNQSPFNVGEVVCLKDFSAQEALALSRIYGVSIPALEIERLMNRIGGHPHLLQSAFHQIARSQRALDQIIAEAGKGDGPFGDHLKGLYAILQRNTHLREGLKDVLRRGETDERLFLSLRRAGMVWREGKRVIFRCRIYEEYFREQFNV